MTQSQDITADERLKHEFNRWADEGRGEEMERHHIPITEPVLAMMNLHTADRVLDLGCGAGWATRRLALACRCLGGCNCSPMPPGPARRAP